MELKFEGVLDGITDKQIKFITSVLNKNGVNDGLVSIETVGKAGDNYASIIKRVIANKSGESFSMIMKANSTNSNPAFEEMQTIQTLSFYNEYNVYSKVLPAYAELEDEAEVKLEDRIITPKCFGAFLEANEEMLLLEDMNKKEYIMLDRFKPLTDDVVKIILTTLAKFHAYSLVLKHRRPKFFEEINTLTPWLSIVKTDEMKYMFAKAEKDIMALIDGRYQLRLVGTLSRLENIISELYVNDSKYNVIHHGDAWSNNMLFKFKDEVVTSCCLIDYQMASLASPVVDLGYMIFNCTDYETRRRHYQDWIDYYHMQFDKTLGDFGLKANLLFSRDRLDSEVRRHAKLTIALCVFSSVMLIKSDEEAAKFKEAMENSTDFESLYENSKMSEDNSNDEVLKSRVEGILATHIEFGLI